MDEADEEFVERREIEIEIRKMEDITVLLSLSLENSQLKCNADLVTFANNIHWRKLYANTSCF